MNIKKATQILELHNKWRRGDDGLKMVDPTELGDAIETVLAKLKNHGDIGEVICCGVLEKMNIGWMKLEDGTKCMPYIKGKEDKDMYRINN